MDVMVISKFPSNLPCVNSDRSSLVSHMSFVRYFVPSLPNLRERPYKQLNYHILSEL